MRQLAWIVTVATAVLFVGCTKGNPCPAKFRDLPNTEGEITCTCTAEQNKGSVWGTNIYTTDSSPCRAAVHAGVIKDAGTIKMKTAPGCEAYLGSEQNGVKASKWGKYQGSFFFPGHGDGKCAEPPKFKAGDPCPGSFKSVPGVKKGDVVKCECANGGSGSVWGSGTYTTDSNICRAAVHAGVIDDEGGMVEAKAVDGCSKYVGDEKNGVTTSKWGSYSMSFIFPKAGGECAE